MWRFLTCLATLMLSAAAPTHKNSGKRPAATRAAAELPNIKEGMQRLAATAMRVRHAELIATNLSVYWRRRRKGALYNTMDTLVWERAARAATALDVGTYESPLLARYYWIPTKVATDLTARPRFWPHIPGIAFVAGDFMQLAFGTRFDLVICNQVVEHLSDSNVTRFVTKLASHTGPGGTLLVSTTHRLPFGVIKGHVQDPISEERFRSWFRPVQSQGTLEVVYCEGGPHGHSNSKGNIIGIWTRSSGARRP